MEQEITTDMEIMQDLDTEFNAAEKKYAILFGQALGPMHVMLGYLHRPNAKK
jgi:hypothetical protein